MAEAKGTTMSLGKGIEQALAELQQAQDALEQAQRATDAARSEQNACLNRVNAAQKEVDELFAAVKQKAHRDTDWARARQPRFPAVS